MRELPEGWKWTRIEDIISKVETTNPEKFPDKEFFYLDIDSVDNSQQKITNPKKIKGNEAPSRARQVVKSGDILFSTVRTYLKNIAFVEEQFDNQIASTGFCVIRLKKDVDNKFIFHYVQTQNFLKKLDLLQRGANYPAVRDCDILSQQIPLPPLPIQRQIVAVLEQVEAVRQQRQEADALTGALLQSVFYEMFGDPVRNERGWELKTVNELIDDGTIIDVQDGNHGELHPKDGDFKTEGIPFITINCIDNGRVIFEKAKRLDEFWLEKLRIGFAHDGDLLLSNKGTVGKSAILKTDYDTVIVAPQVTYYRIEKNSSLNSLFLFGVFQTWSFKANLERLGAAQSTRAYANLTKQKAMLLPLPPLSLQQQFARIVEDVERVREKQVASGKEIEGLCEGLMQRAFAGELG